MPSKFIFDTKSQIFVCLNKDKYGAIIGMIDGSFPTLDIFDTPDELFDNDFLTSKRCINIIANINNLDDHEIIKSELNINHFYDIINCL